MNKRSIITKSFMLTMSMIGIVVADNHSLQHSLTRWSGFYAGTDGGILFNNVQLESQQLGFTNLNETCDVQSDFSTYFPGIQLGYMHQFSNYFVLGIEANFSTNTTSKDTLSCPCTDNSNVSDSFFFRNQKQGSIKGRVGHVLNWKNLLLPYITAGASFANAGLSYSNEGGDYYSKKTNLAGALIGTGIEWAFWKNWSLRAEYSYVEYGNTIKLKIPSIYGLVDPNGNAHANLSTNTITLAINYWIM